MYQLNGSKAIYTQAFKAYTHLDETMHSQIEQIEIDYDAHTNVVRLRAGRSVQANLIAYNLPVQRTF